MHKVEMSEAARNYDVMAAPLPIQMFRGEWVDTLRHGRVVPYKIYAPENMTEAAPTIIWSHGLGGSRDGAGFISRHLAGRGYVVVHVQHAGTDSGLWEGKPGHPWDVIRAAHIPRKATLSRYQDVPFALAQLRDIGAAHPELEGKLDFGRMGMSGHSFGALTTQIMAGQYLLRRGSKHRYDLFQPVFKAGILYSPGPLYSYPELAADAYKGIRIPLLHMTGTDDDSPIGGFDYKQRLAVSEYASKGTQYLVVFDGGDHMVYNGSRGKLAANPLRDAHERAIIAGATAFWDAYLKNDKVALDWLENGGYEAILSDGDRFQIRHP